MVSNTQLYGAAIAFGSGVYSVWSTSTMSSMGISGWLMLLVGIIVIVHGAVLLTDYADRLSFASGLLMIAYSIVMLFNQVFLGIDMMDGSKGMGMSGGTGMGSSPMTAGIGWDAGMVILAVLMLVSGLIMSRNGEMNDTTHSM